VVQINGERVGMQDGAVLVRVDVGLGPLPAFVGMLVVAIVPVPVRVRVLGRVVVVRQGCEKVHCSAAQRLLTACA
jgi:hypothetical protein